MTPMQAACFVTSQCMMMQAEMSLLIAHAYGAGRPPDAGKLAVIIDRYEPMLRADVVKKLFDDANAKV